MSRALITTVGPLAAASANNIAASQKAARSGLNVLVLNGSATDAVANNICQSQTPAGAGALTLNGSLCTSNQPIGFGGTGTGSTVAYISNAYGTPRYIYFTYAANDSARTMTVIGTVQTPGTFGPGIVVIEAVPGANASTVSSRTKFSTIISISADAATAGAVQVGVNGVATLDAARRLLFTPGGADVGLALTLIGGDWSGNPITEIVTDVSNPSTVASLLDYKTVTDITVSAAIATTMTVGTNGVAGSPWLRLDELGAMGPTALQVDGSGTINWTVQQTLNDPNVITNPLPTPTYLYAEAGIFWVNHPDSAFVASAVVTGVQGNYAYPPKLARLVCNSNTNPAFVTLTVMQNYQR